MKYGDVAILEEPVAQELLRSAIPARLAYVWLDGTPRVVPMWFHWTGSEIVFCCPSTAPKVKALGLESKVALTIDSEQWPAQSLTIRGTARSTTVEGEIPEYADMVRKYLGDGTDAWREQYRQMFPRVVRIAVKPEWVNLMDIPGNRFPSAIEEAIAAMSAAN